ncbi:MAG TPA: SGNH/GDSL hydrolase family protein [Planctomycetota bacterium]|nr:SGNH/GDSL hydrolase family protein [Planctomycetota bacterium]
MAQSSDVYSQQHKSRLVALATAAMHGVHFGQVLKHETGKDRGDEALFSRGSLSVDQLKELFESFKKLITFKPEAIVAWSRGNESGDSAEITRLVEHLRSKPIPADERLPVNAMVACMRRRLTGPEEFFVRAVASLVQLCLQMEHDGGLLQDLIRVYVALGIKQLSLPLDEEGQRALGKELAPIFAKSPFWEGANVNDPVYVYSVIRKLNVWIDKTCGRRDRYVLGKELLEDPEIKPLLPKLKQLSPRRVAFLGHSMMMSLHWTTFGSWCDLAGEVVKNVNPGFEYRDFQSGGLTATRAIKEHLTPLLEWRPHETYLLMFIGAPGEPEAYEQIMQKLRTINTKIYIVDDVRYWLEIPREVYDTFREMSRKYGATILDYAARGKSAPGHEKFEALDVIHMNTEGHIFYCKETLKMWANEA